MLRPEEYADIYQALRQLGRVADACELCERAIFEFDHTAACFAYYMKGWHLLHTYDSNGIDYIYRAMEINSNYIDEGLDEIGTFCCLTGRQEDLDIYRKKAIELAQKQNDVYSEMTILKKTDTIISEQLPEELLKNILNYIESIEENSIRDIYLVRKVITDNFFTSVFVIRFKEKIEEERKEKIMHKIFSYLDTCSEWNFSLFEYSEVRKMKIEKVENSLVYSHDNI